MHRYFLFVLILSSLLLGACSSPAPAVVDTPLPPTATAQPATPQPTEAPAAEPTGTEVHAPQETEPAGTAGPEEPFLSFEAATFREDEAGFEFKYPAGWTVSDPVVYGDRAYGYQLLSEGEPILNVTLQRWDPINDLEAFVAARKQAWGASGFTILSEEVLAANGGPEAGRFLIQTQVGDQAFFFFMPVGDRYLELSGERDLDLLAEISRTLHLTGVEGQPGAAGSLDCSTAAEDTAEGVACQVIDGLHSRNLSALHGYMANPFALGYWGSEGYSASPEEVTAELQQARLPADPASLLTFTTDRDLFPTLGGMPPEAMFGPAMNIVLALYSEGWGPDGEDAAMLFITQDESGEYLWSALIYSMGHFDQ